MRTVSVNLPVPQQSRNVSEAKWCVLYDLQQKQHRVSVRKRSCVSLGKDAMSEDLLYTTLTVLCALADVEKKKRQACRM